MVGGRLRGGGCTQANHSAVGPALLEAGGDDDDDDDDDDYAIVYGHGDDDYDSDGYMRCFLFQSKDVIKTDKSIFTLCVLFQ